VTSLRRRAFRRGLEASKSSACQGRDLRLSNSTIGGALAAERDGFQLPLEGWLPTANTPPTAASDFQLRTRFQMLLLIGQVLLEAVNWLLVAGCFQPQFMHAGRKAGLLAAPPLHVYTHACTQLPSTGMQAVMMMLWRYNTCWSTGKPTFHSATNAKPNADIIASTASANTRQRQCKHSCTPQGLPDIAQGCSRCMHHMQLHWNGCLSKKRYNSTPYKQHAVRKVYSRHRL
jgi:hypothetical protein